MAVPSSYQDLSQDRDRMNHIGWVWYDRDFWVPLEWDVTTKRISLRFGSVNYYAIVVSFFLPCFKNTFWKCHSPSLNLSLHHMRIIMV